MRDYSFLLERPEWDFPENSIDDYFRGRRVMVTGAGGSIGSAVVNRLSGVARFVGALGHSELPLFNLKASIPAEHGQIRLADIRFPLDEIFEQWKPDVVIHAAAHKHVGLMEDQPREAFHNNVFGTINVASTALKFGVKNFVFISTDKAARPTTVMGASKKLAEYWLMSHMRNARVVRFGNVLGSAGSLIDILERRIAEEKSVVLTHRDMVRFFITIREAVGLILTAASLCDPGVYSLDMGEQLKVMDVVLDLARKIGKEIHIEIGNPVEGEKLSEDILNPSEHISDPGLSGIRRIKSEYFPDCWDLMVSQFHSGKLTLVETANKI